MFNFLLSASLRFSPSALNQFNVKPMAGILPLPAWVGQYVSFMDTEG